MSTCGIIKILSEGVSYGRKLCKFHNYRLVTQIRMLDLDKKQTNQTNSKDMFSEYSGRMQTTCL
jgi:hypothetical protein